MILDFGLQSRPLIRVGPLIVAIKNLNHINIMGKTCLVQEVTMFMIEAMNGRFRA